MRRGRRLPALHSDRSIRNSTTNGRAPENGCSESKKVREQMVKKAKRDPLLDVVDRMQQEARRALSTSASVGSKSGNSKGRTMGKKADKTYSCVVTITAKSEEAADEMRSEIVGAIEDNHESGEIAAEAFVGDLEPVDVAKELDAVDNELNLEKYRALHGRLSDLIEDGKLDALKKADPKAYKGLVEAMTELARLDPKPESASDKATYAP